jgi:tetratricopeptide (TPR) repeat protein
MAWYFMGILKMENDSAASALNCFSEVISLDPEFLPAQLEISRLFLELKEYRRAIIVSRNLLESALADRTEVLEILGAACFEDRRINEAEEIFLTLLETDPMSISALVYLGDIAERKARTEEAVNYYLRALELDTENEEARSRLRVIAGDSYNPESNAESLEGFSASAAADVAIERGNRALLEWGGNASVSYLFDRRRTSVNASFGGRSVTWEENSGLKKNTLNTNRGWASIGIDYWFSDSYYVEAASNWDRQMYTERPWQISSYAAAGWQKWMLS